MLLVLLAQLWEHVQPWAMHLVSDRAQSLVAVLMLVLLYAVWHSPSEGWGMTVARLLLSTGVLVVLTRNLYTQRMRQRGSGGLNG
jgi:hypothetical protein